MDDRTIARFEAKIAFAEMDECWLWQAQRNHNGYGRIRVGNRLMRAHRVAFELAHGPMPEDHVACHSCDTPACVNPYHLFPGTHEDNMRDRDAKGRTPKGEKHKLAKIDSQTARDIRGSLLSQRAAARMYGISRRAVRDIRAAKTWRHA